MASPTTQASSGGARVRGHNLATDLCKCNQDDVIDIEATDGTLQIVILERGCDSKTSLRLRPMNAKVGVTRNGVYLGKGDMRLTRVGKGVPMYIFFRSEKLLRGNGRSVKINGVSEFGDN
jgi:hypothetical protein